MGDFGVKIGGFLKKFKNGQKWAERKPSVRAKLTPKHLPKKHPKNLYYARDLISKSILDIKWVTIETFGSKNLGSNI
jgi:hypothetical protein